MKNSILTTYYLLLPRKGQAPHQIENCAQRSTDRRGRKGSRLVTGQVMVELMVAMGVLAVGITGMMALLNQSIGLNREVANDFTGTYLAAEGVEIMKNLLQGNFVRQLSGEAIAWDEGFTDGTYEVDLRTTSLPPPLSPIATAQAIFYDPSSRLYGYLSGSGAQATTFTREVSIVHMSTDEIRVISRVLWRVRGGGTAESIVEDHFYNWVGVPNLP